MIEIGHGISIAPLRLELLDVTVREEDDWDGRRNTYTFLFAALHRDTGNPIKLELTETVLLDSDGSSMGEPFQEMIRRVLRTAMCHEVDEVLRLNGKRLRDPHQW